MRKAIKYKNLTWIDITEPTAEDIKYLKKNFKLHPLTLKALIPIVHYPDLDVFKNYLFLILHYPDSKKNGDVQSQELDIIAEKNYLITSHYHDIFPLNYFFERCSKSESDREKFMAKGAGFLLFSILNKFLKEVLKKIGKIENEIDEIEKEIFQEREKEMAKEISYLKRKIIDFWRIVEPQRTIFDSIPKPGARFFGDAFKPYFSILFHIQQRIENILKNSKETIESLEETNHILVTLKTNEIMRTLTIFSVILLPLTLLASIWGMNTNFLPFGKTSLDFWLIIGLMATVTFIMVSYFKNKKWL